ESAAPGVFLPDETVEVVPDELPNEDFFRIWETLGQNVTYRLSVPYVARNVRIEAQEPLDLAGPAMQERLLRYARHHLTMMGCLAHFTLISDTRTLAHIGLLL